MGPDPRAAGRDVALSGVVQVVPALPTFSVDDGFTYLVPDDMELGTGSIVRVPLGGRRVRGYVVGRRREERTGLKEVAGVSGDLPVFHPGLLETLRWAAIHYVAPLAVLLAKTAPPNLPRAARLPPPPPPPDPVAGAGPRPDPVQPRVFVAGTGPAAGVAAAVAGEEAAAGRSTLVVLPTLVEAKRLAALLVRSFGERLVFAASGVDAADATAAWVRAATVPGTVVVGTREVAFWPVAAPGAAVIVEEGRPGMKDRQTPTTHVREVLRRRAAIEGFRQVYLGPLPTAEVLAARTALLPRGPRWWPLVEIVDRTEDPPGGGLLSPRVRAAVRATAGEGRRVFVFTHRRGYAPAFRCVRCRTLRRCPGCGARPDRPGPCGRCGAAQGACTRCGETRFEPLGAGVGRILEELGRGLGDLAGEAGGTAPVQVGTERDLPLVGEQDLAVVVDADGLVLAPHYRAEEDALRLLARVAGTVAGGRGRRCIVQTAMPGHPVLAALRRGTGDEFMAGVLAGRDREGLPPFGDLLVVEVAGGGEERDGELRAAMGEAAVHGPATAGERVRWLVQGPDLRKAKVALRTVVQGWRDAGLRVRVDVDPIDL